MPTPHYGQPRYRRIAHQLRKRIEDGVILPGTLLPTESALTTEFRASRGTIRQAIAILRDEGLVITEHGRGTYANAAFYVSGWDQDADLRTSQREINADAELACLFNVETGTTLIELQSIRRQGEKVETVTRTYRLDQPNINSLKGRPHAD